MKKQFCVIVLIAVLVLSCVSVFAQATDVMKENVIVPFSNIVFIQCACDGEGELVELNGSVHYILYTKIDNNGVCHCFIHKHPMGVKGIGLTSGDIYQSNGGMVCTTKTSSEPFPININYISIWKLIGPGTGNNYSLHFHGQLTINVNGDITVDFVKVSVECK